MRLRYLRGGVHASLAAVSLVLCFSVGPVAACLGEACADSWEVPQAALPQEAKLTLAPGLTVVGRSNWPTAADSTAGLYLNALYLDLAPDPLPDSVTLRLGKLTPRMMSHWEQGPKTDRKVFAGAGYYPSERIGFMAGGRYDAGAFGRQHLRASVFMPDTTPLSRDWIQRFTFADGGSSSCVQLPNSPSAAIALNGSAIPGMPRLRYHMQFLHEGSRYDDRMAGWGFNSALTYTLPLRNLRLVPLVEHTRFADLNGNATGFGSYTTTGVGLDWRSLELAITHTAGQMVAPYGGLAPSTHIDISGMLQLDFGLVLSASWSHREVGGQPVDVARSKLAYRVNF